MLPVAHTIVLKVASKFVPGVVCQLRVPCLHTHHAAHPPPLLLAHAHTLLSAAAAASLRVSAAA
jgi:hypothetical protein